MLTGLAGQIVKEGSMTKFRKTVIKICSLLCLACTAFALSTIPSAKTVNAADDNFKVNGTSIYAYDVEGESKVGLRFEAEVTDDWFKGKTADKYTFGMIIAPTANFTAFNSEENPAYNMAQVDGFNFIRIQNKAKSEITEKVFYAGILFDDDSLIGIIEDINDKNGTPVNDEMVLQQLANLKGNIFKQSYSAVVYATYNGNTDYLTRYDTTMRETAAKTYSLGVAKNDEESKDLALPYLGVTEGDVYTQSAYVALTDNKLVVDSAENFEIKEGDLIIGGCKILNYDIVDGAVVLENVKSAKTVETVVIFRDTDINIVEVTYTDVALSTPEDVVDYLMSEDWEYSSAAQAYIANKSAVLANDIDMSAETLYNYSRVNFSGTFDGRGHVLSNVTLDILKASSGNSSSFSLFGVITATGVVKNVAFDNIKAVDVNPNAGLLGYTFSGKLENVYVSIAVDNKARTGLFVQMSGGNMKNVVVMDNGYDTGFNIDDYMSDYYGVSGISTISRLIPSNKPTFENVQIISQRPINYNSSSTNYDATYNAAVADDPATEEDETQPATIKDWGARFVYGENEVDVWYQFDYFYRSATDATKPGLGLVEGEANVANTKNGGKTIF